MNNKIKYLHIIIFMCFFFSKQTIYAQLSIWIDSLYVTYINDAQDFVNPVIDQNNIVEIFSEDKEQGPYINVYTTFENLGTDTLFLDTILDVIYYSNKFTEFDIVHNPNDGIYLTYFYKNKLYELLPNTICTAGKLLPYQSRQVEFGGWIFLGTDIKRPGGNDYSKEVIECLPTLQVIFKYNDKVYKSCGIKKVVYVADN